MLTFEDIIKFLNRPQKKIQNDSACNSVATDESVQLPDIFHTLHKTFKECQFIKTNGNFYYAFLVLIDNNFIASPNKQDAIKNLRKKLWECIDISFKKYGYNRKRKFNKNQLQSELTNFDKCEKPSEQIMKYLVDFFGINLYILRAEDLAVEHMLAVDDGEECIFKPCILLLKDNGKYYPVMIGNKSLFLYSKDDIVKDLYDRFIPRKTTKPKKQTKPVEPDNDCEPDPMTNEPILYEQAKEQQQEQQNTEPILYEQQEPAQQQEKVQTEQQPTEEKTAIKRRATTKMVLEELQKIAKEFNISLTKPKPNGKGVMNKTKRELYDDINS